MKNTVLFLMAFLFLASCAKQDLNEQFSDQGAGIPGNQKDVGYHPLIAGQNDTIGTVNYILTSDYFYVNYILDEGWTMTESHVYAGQNIAAFRNNAGSPKIGRFPYARYYSPATDNDSYELSLAVIRPDTNLGFQVAAHCVVNGPGNQNETAWAWGNSEFKDKDWGWFDDISFDSGEDITLLITISTGSDGSLHVYELNTDMNTTGLLIDEMVGGTPGTYDGVAVVSEEAVLLFAKQNENGTSTLYYNDLTDNAPSVSSGTLAGEAGSGTYHDGNYYYVDAVDHTIQEVTFADNTWNVADDITIGTIAVPNFVVNDIAWTPGGTKMFILGDITVGGQDLEVKIISFDGTNNTFMTYTITGDPIPLNSQIANVTDSAITVISPGVSGVEVRTVTISGNTVTGDDDDVIDVGGGDDDFDNLTDGGGEVIDVGGGGF